MKWLYPPFMFALAFFYAKINYSDYMPKSNQWPASRAPAQQLQTCREMLSDFYPAQTSDFIDMRLENNSDFFSFFRAFSPVFYKEMQTSELNLMLKPFEKFKGTIAADLHIENFGFILDDKGKVVFTVNDIDDATEGEIARDVIRHFVSAKIVHKDIKWEDYYSAYQKGLKGESHNFSFHVNKGMEDVADVTKKNLEKNIDFEGPFKFIKFKKPYRMTTAEENADLLKALKEKFPKIEIFDQYMRMKEDGGSAGLKRYQVLARVSPKDKVQWLDVKETAMSGYDRVFNPESKISFAERLAAVKANIYNDQLDESLKVVTIQNHPYSVRFVDQFSSGLKLADIPEDDYRDVILDEAYVIGKIHKLSLKDNALDYAQTWSEVKNGAFEEQIVNLKFRLKDIYENSKKVQP